MSEYIEANAFKEWYAKNIIHDDAFDNLVDMQPKADVRPNVHGKWLYEQLIPNNLEGKMYGECSVCHKVRIVDNFCPNCGADMRKGETNG